MFTPEFINEKTGEYVLVANHSLKSDEAVAFSIAYNRARIAYGAAHLSPHITRCIVVYDIRGQNVPDNFVERLRLELDAICEIRIKQ